MYPANRTLNRQNELALYMLKRQYGGYIEVCQIVSSTADPETGELVVTKTVTPIDRAIVLPARLKREAKRSISAISANKEFVTGGYYDTAERDIVIDYRDAPDLTVTTADWLVYDNRKYEIKDVVEVEFHSAVILTVRALPGEPTGMEIKSSVTDTLRLTDTSTGS